jgi:hypothetical protein
VPSVRRARPDVPAELAAVLERMLAKNPADRYATPAEVVAALRPFAGDTLPAEAPTATWDRPQPPGPPAESPAARDTHASRQTVPERSALGRRRLSAARRRLALALPLFGLLILTFAWWKFEPGARPLNPLPPDSPVPAAPGPSEPRPGPDGLVHRDPQVRVHGLARPRVEDFRVRLYRGEVPKHQGDLGATVLEARFDDDLRVEARLTAPAYFYLLAYNPDGKEQLCYPADQSVAPPLKQDLTYPNIEDHYFGLNDGLGVQAFVLLVSRNPLPTFDLWKRAAGKAPWKAFTADGVWQFDGEDFSALPRDRGQERPRLAAHALPDALAAFAQTPVAPFSGIPWGLFYNGPPKPVIDLGQYYRDRGFDAVHLLAFPVRAKKK